MRWMIILLLCAATCGCRDRCHDRRFYRRVHEQTLRAALIEAVNEERARVGLQALRPQSDLMEGAQNWTQTMHRRHRLVHDRNADCAENIAWGQDTVEEVMRAWMHSRGHRRNILGDYRYIGAGVDGAYWCLRFSNFPF